MKTIFSLAVQIDPEKKQCKLVLGCESKDDFDKDSLKVIESCSEELAKMVTMAYTRKLIDFTTETKESEVKA